MIWGIYQWLWSEIGLVLEAAGFVILFTDLIGTLRSEARARHDLLSVQAMARNAPYTATGVPPSPHLWRDVLAEQAADQAAAAEIVTDAWRRTFSVLPAALVGGLGFFASGIGNWQGHWPF